MDKKEKRRLKRSHVAPFIIHSKALETKQLRESTLDDGSIKFNVEWYASTIVKDGSGDIVLPDAFNLTRYKQNPVLKLWHKRGEENNIWMVTSLETKQDGLYIKADIILSPEIEEHKKIIHWLRHWLIKWFSIWFGDVKSFYDEEKDANVITSLELYEISLVDIPDNPMTVLKAFEKYQEIKAAPWELRVWDMVSRNSSWWRARGKIVDIENREWEWFSPTWSDMVIRADETDPVALINLFRGWEPTGQNVVHKFSTLTKIWENWHYDEEEKKLNDEVEKEIEGMTKELDEVFAKYKKTVNMSASELESRSKTDCSKKASLDRSPINRNLRLLRKNKSERTGGDITDANRTISFVSRMKANLWGSRVIIDENGRQCGTKAFISLKNRAYDDNKKSTSEIFTFDIEKMTKEEMIAKMAEMQEAIDSVEESTEETKEIVEVVESEETEEKSVEEKEEDKKEDDEPQISDQTEQLSEVEETKLTEEVSEETSEEEKEETKEEVKEDVVETKSLGWNMSQEFTKTISEVVETYNEITKNHASVISKLTDKVESMEKSMKALKKSMGVSWDVMYANTQEKEEDEKPKTPFQEQIKAWKESL